jgi:hypothetical protein
MDKYKTYIPEYSTDFGYNMQRASRVQDSMGRNTNNYAKAKKGNSNAKKLSLEQCKEIKKLLMENTNELIKDKVQRIADLYSVSKNTISSIKSGDHWSNKEMD